MSSVTTEVALITGGGSGIGRASAVALAARGAKVALLDVDEKGLADAYEELTAQGAEVIQVVADVTDPNAIGSAVERVVEAWGGLRTVVASAGIEYVGTVESTSLGDFRRVLDVALVGTFITAQATIPHLRAGGGGSFTAIGSTTGASGSNGWAAYSAAKHGVVGLTRSMALDHARDGVRCNVVLPGFIQTPMAARILEGLSDGDLAATDNAIPLGRRAHPSEVADAVAHLSSEDASYVTGSLYAVDGGTLAGFFEPPAG